MSAGTDRLTGFERTLERAGLPADAVELADFTAAGASTALRAWRAGSAAAFPPRAGNTRSPDLIGPRGRSRAHPSAHAEREP